MPGKNGTGPAGQGSRRGQGRKQGGSGRGRGGGYGAGPGGNCICPNCGEKAAHQQGIACFDMNCPKCGTAMVRE
jgi:hypothetical protein